MRKENKPKSRKENIVVQEVDGEVLIYDLERDKAYCLNKTSAIVWQTCDGTRTIAEINDHLGKQLNAQTDEDIVWLALDQLSKEKLIDPSVDLKSKFEGMSRREVVRKIGLGSVVALPLVASLVAPSPLMAQSDCPGIGGMTQNGGDAGMVTLVSPVGCIGVPLAERDAQCFILRRDNCCSRNAAETPGSCVQVPAGQIEFNCTCIP